MVKLNLFIFTPNFFQNTDTNKHKKSFRKQLFYSENTPYKLTPNSSSQLAGIPFHRIYLEQINVVALKNLPHNINPYIWVKDVKMFSFVTQLHLFHFSFPSNQSIFIIPIVLVIYYPLIPSFKCTWQCSDLSQFHLYIWYIYIFIYI